MKAIRIALALTVVLSFLALTNGCGSAQDPWEGKGGSPRIVTSFAPLYCFARNVAGDKAGIVCICQGSKGPHGYRETHEDLLTMRRADLLIANGMGLDDGFMEKLKRSGTATLRYLKVAETIDKSLIIGGGHPDPHLWLGVKQAKAMVSKIRDVLKESGVGDPSVNYDANATAYLKKLDKLKDYKKKELAAIKSPIVTFHESLNYFADSFGLKIAGSIRVTPESEIGGPRIRELIALCLKEKVEIIAVEPQYKKAEAENLKKQLVSRGLKNVKLVRVDPLEACEVKDLNADWYIRKMQENIDNLVGSQK